VPLSEVNVRSLCQNEKVYMAVPDEDWTKEALERVEREGREATLVLRITSQPLSNAGCSSIRLVFYPGRTGNHWGLCVQVAPVENRHQNRDTSILITAIFKGFGTTRNSRRMPLASLNLPADP